MKKSVDIINLPIVDISEGAEIGTASKIVINSAEGSVVALVVDDGKWYLGAKLLPFSAIAGLGESAITTISASSVIAVENSPEMEQLLAADITVIGTNVLTKAGKLIGTVKEISIDTTGKIASCEMEELNGEIKNIPGESILTFGKKVLIIADEAEDIVVASTPAETVKVVEPSPIISTVIETMIPEPTPEPTPEPIPTTTVKEKASDDSAKKFDEKQRKYLLGKQASRRIETDNGVLIVDQGGEINEEVLQKAKLAGKFVELSMNIQ